MPLPIAFLVALACGVSLAWLARAELGRSEVPIVLARPFLVAVGMGLLVVAPASGYFAALHGDWAYLYLVRSSRIPSAIDLVLVVATGAAVPAGFALAAPWAAARRSTPVLRLLGALVFVVLAVVVASSRRLTVSATWTQWHGGFGGAPLGRSALGRGVLSSWIALLLGYAWSAFALRTPTR